ncbi:hypothetical protein PGTUg99_003831 [Puccinia graminis f. sp. tritici]|uniref:Integrase core domain-containing protein n=1 Tax=Puccinia graminis f. sp. tritici TaxID=56615 RepID=A0A5B0RH28_PUCGR|nr:hypothetical protein PGTUg99_003831 [Puccinia graminis f. sp. tritici]
MDDHQIVVTDYSEFSGSDDETDSSDTQDASNNSDALNENEDPWKIIITDLLSQGHKGPAIVTILRETHDYEISLSTLARKRKMWGLQLRDLPKKPRPAIRASIVSSHSKGLQLKEIQARLLKETGVDVSVRTIKRYMSQLNLKQLANDLAQGIVTRQQVNDCISHIRTDLLSTASGYRVVTKILKTYYSIRLPRTVVYNILQEIEPDAVEARRRQACKRRVYRTHGPNHIWSCDGHDKLKRFGLCIYGFIDAWSRKILGMFVHVTNNDPRHIGVYFLQLVKAAGGIPLKVTTDYGTETIDMSALQMMLSYQNTPALTMEEAKLRMHFTKSTHNQKIESLWSQLMKQHNQAIINNIMPEIENGDYDENDYLQKNLFLFLWLPVLQTSLDRWVHLKNETRKRKDRRIELPTGFAPEFLYGTPEHFGTEDHLVPIPVSRIENLLLEHYPDREEMFRQTPPWFHETAMSIMNRIGLRFSNITIGTVWLAFYEMLPHIRQQFPPGSFPTEELETQDPLTDSTRTNFA